MGVIYVRPNLINGKKYVGQATTKNFKSRQNKWKSNSYRYAGKAINAARAKYGIESFGFEILKECDDKELDYWEKYYIKELNTKVPNGYNMTDGGDSTYERTEETRKKMSDAKRGRKLSDETRKKMSDAQRGKKRPDISAVLKGKKRSEETKAKISDARRGKHYSKLSDAMRGKPKSPEHIAKVAAAHRGMKQSEETKAKISDAMRGKPKSPEHIAKVAAANSKAVQALDKVTGEVVMEFPSTKEAGRQGFSQGLISQCCNGQRKSHKGFIWRWKSV